MRWLSYGATDAQIAGHLVLPINTVRSHREWIRDKTGARRRAELVRYAIEADIIDQSPLLPESALLPRCDWPSCPGVIGLPVVNGADRLHTCRADGAVRLRCRVPAGRTLGFTQLRGTWRQDNGPGGRT